MPDTETPVAPAPAAAPTPAPSAPATPPPAPAPTASAAPKESPGSRLFKALSQAAPSLEEIANGKPKDKPAEAKPTDAPAKPDAAAAPAAPDKAAKPAKEIKRREKDAPAAPAADVPPQVPRREPKTPAPAIAAASAPVVPAAAPELSDADFEKSLIDEEQAMLADARAAEKFLGDKYKGQAAKTTAYLRENLKRLQAVEKGELNGKPYDEEDHKKWAATAMPKISVLDQREIFRKAAAEEAEQRVAPRIAEESHARWRDTEEPKLKTEAESLRSNLRSTAYPDDLMTAAEQRLKGLTAGTPEYNAALTQIRTEYALEIEVAEQVIEAATGDMQEFKRLTTKNPATGRPLAEFDVNNPQHERIVKIVETVCNDFKASGGPELRKDGKWFATREEWARMNDMVRAGELPQAELAKWWTFTDKDITERAMALVKPAVAAQTTQRRAAIEKYGFKRQAPTAAAPAATVPPTPPGSAPAAPRSAPPPPSGSATPATGLRRLASTLSL